MFCDLVLGALLWLSEQASLIAIFLYAKFQVEIRKLTFQMNLWNHEIVLKIHIDSYIWDTVSQQEFKCASAKIGSRMIYSTTSQNLNLSSGKIRGLNCNIE